MVKGRQVHLDRRGCASRVFEKIEFRAYGLGFGFIAWGRRGGLALPCNSSRDEIVLAFLLRTDHDPHEGLGIVAFSRWVGGLLQRPRGMYASIYKDYVSHSGGLYTGY